MEHRYNKRSLATIDVMVSHHDNPPINTRTLNVGGDGMFIESGSVVFRKNTLINVVFDVELSRHHETTRRYCLPVMVVHSSKAGTGVMFRETESESFHAWKKLVQRARSQSANDNDMPDHQAAPALRRVTSTRHSDGYSVEMR